MSDRVDLTPESKESNIIRLEGGKPLEIELKERGEKHCSCNWRGSEPASIVVDDELRQVTCEDCKRVIDPFDYLLDWAKSGHRRMTGIKGLDVEIKQKSAELLQIKAAITRERAKLRKANPNAPELERYPWMRTKVVSMSDWEIQI